MLIHNASQLLTLIGGPQRGKDLGRLGILPNGALLIQADQIAAVGDSDSLLSRYPHEPRLDARGRVVMPGLVDPHTHALWMGDRAAEFELRLEGKTYMEIMAAGGGIASTVRATRQASRSELLQAVRAHLNHFLRCGTTTAEIKTGYGLSTESELLHLEILREVAEHPAEVQVVPTFLPAHAVPPEYKESPDAYVDLICREMLPRAAQAWRERGTPAPLPFVDVFCEQGAFDLTQTRRILETAKALGFPLKVHVDEFENLGGASLAAELGAASADHLVKTSPADIAALAQSDTVAVALPCTPFGLADPNYTPARAILEAGGLLALASDHNPGTAWCGSMQFVIALACRYLRLTVAQAVAAATINAAAAVQRQQEIGSLEAGKRADVLILNVDDYRKLGYQFGGNLTGTVIQRGAVKFQAENIF